MVELAEIQTAYYMVAATGVLVAAAYYVMTLRTTQRNMKVTLETRRIGLVDNLITRTLNEEGMKRYFELLNMEWKDYDEFETKYGSDNNVENAAKRYEVWNNYTSIGAMVRKGLVEAEDIYDAGMIGTFYMWAKFKDVIEEGRRRYNGQDFMQDFEYLAGEMMRVKLQRDPSYKLPETLSKYIPNN